MDSIGPNPPPGNLEAVSAKLIRILLPTTISQPPQIDPLLNKNAPNVILLQGDSFDIGRTMTCKSVINSIQISRKHCFLQRKNGKWYIEDFSTNGVLLNGIRLVKGTLNEIRNHDIIDMIPPGGALSYKFEYHIPVPLPSESITTTATAVPSTSTTTSALPIPPDDPGCSSDPESESLLSIDDDSDMFITADCGNDNEDLMDIEEMDQPTINKIKVSSFKRSAEFLSALSKSERQSVIVQAQGSNTCSRRLDFHFNDIIEEDLLDLEDLEGGEGEGPGGPPMKQLKKVDVTEVIRPFASDSNRIPSEDKTTTKKPVTVSTTDALDNEILSKQLKHFTDQCHTLKSEKKLLALELEMEKRRHKDEVNLVTGEVLKEKEELYTNLNNALETEVSCSICNEVYIQATVIDCGHTFCHHCITEWISKKQDCPICRTKITVQPKQVDLNNLLTKIHTFLPLEFQQRREALVKERETEIEVGQVAKEAEIAEILATANLQRQRPFGRRGRGRPAAAAAAAGAGNDIDYDAIFVRDLLQAFSHNNYDPNFPGLGLPHPPPPPPPPPVQNPPQLVTRTSRNRGPVGGWNDPPPVPAPRRTTRHVQRIAATMAARARNQPDLITLDEEEN